MVCVSLSYWNNQLDRQISAERKRGQGYFSSYFWIGSVDDLCGSGLRKTDRCSGAFRSDFRVTGLKEFRRQRHHTLCTGHVSIVARSSGSATAPTHIPI